MINSLNHKNMPQKKSNILPLFVVIGIVIAIVALSQLLSGGGKVKTTLPPDDATYKRIATEIDSVAKAKWDGSTYQVVLDAIEDSPTLNEKQKKDLNELLISKYKGVLQDTLIAFCKRGASLAIPAKMQTEITEMKKRIANTGLDMSGIIQVKDTFEVYVRHIQSIDGYTYSSPYDKGTSDNYKTLLEHCKNDVEHLRENDFFKAKIDATIKAIGAHGALDSQFKICTVTENCDCKKFTTNTYYRNECDKWEKKRNETKPEPETKPE
jgi:hypothetical protein